MTAMPLPLQGKRIYPGCDVVIHAVFVKESHLFLNGSVDAGVPGVQAHDKEAPVIEFFHESELFFKGHVGRTAHGGTGFGVVREFHGDKTAGVEDEVGLFKEVLAFNGDQFRISGAGPDDLDESPAFDSTIMATAKVKSLPSLSLPFCFSRSRRVFPVDFRAAASATLGEEVTSRTFSEGLGTEMFRSSSGEYESIESIKL